MQYSKGLNRPRAAFAALGVLALAGCDHYGAQGPAPTVTNYDGHPLVVDVPPVNGTPAVRFLCKDEKCDDKAAVTGDTEGDRWNKMGTGFGNAAMPFATLGSAAILGPTGAGASVAIDNVTSAVGQQKINKTNATNNGQNDVIQLQNFNDMKFYDQRINKVTFCLNCG